MSYFGGDDSFNNQNNGSSSQNNSFNNPRADSGFNSSYSSGGSSFGGVSPNGGGGFNPNNSGQQQPPRPGQGSRITPTNLPPANASGSGPLNKSEEDYLARLAEQNYAIKKTTKRYSKSSITENARSLSKVRRLYSARMGHRYFPFPYKKVADLRDRAGGAIKAFGAAAKKTKRLVLTIVIIVAILATIGTGAAVAVMAINNKNANAFYEGQFVISETTNVPAHINSYILGQKIDLPLYVRNRTNQSVEVRFKIDTVAEPDTPLYNAIRDGLVDPTQLVITYYYDEAQWTMSDGYLYYIGGEGYMPDSDKEIEVISGFAIDIASTTESNKWVNYQMTINFIVEFDQLGS